MNISKQEQRVLHELALGGAIHYERHDNGKIIEVTCYTREGHVLSDCALPVFQRLKKRRFVTSQGGRPYSVSRQGVKAVRSQLNQR